MNGACRPKNSLERGPGSSRGCILRALFLRMPNLPTKAGIEGVRGRELAQSEGLGARESPAR
eukprot:5555932-Alexandrium_andersonii.AAC.1